MHAEKPSGSEAGSGHEGAPGAAKTDTAKVPESFETHPSRYRHFQLKLDGAVARLEMAVREDEPLVPGYQLKLNSYDLGVDIELADAVQRLRFSHPEVRTVIVTSGRDRVFCAGANIHMLAQSTHAFKVNFCKYTNETRLSIEDACKNSGQRYLAAVNGPCAGGGYELAMACEEIVLIDDGSSSVSLPEVPLLGVLPGTGGLTRLIDKRRVRRDRADVFATLAEGIRGKRAVQWGLVDESAPRSRFAERVAARAQALAGAGGPVGKDDAVDLEPLSPTVTADGVRYRFVELQIETARRLATLTLTAPSAPTPATLPELAAQARAGELWALRAFREFDDALLRLRFHAGTVGLVLLRTRGDAQNVIKSDEALAALREHRLPREVLLHQARVLRRLDQTARSFFAVVDPTSCFAGSLLEVLLAADRSYVLEDPGVTMRLSVANRGALPMHDGQSRIAARFCGRSELADAVLQQKDGAAIDAGTADELGLCTVLADDIDFEDTLRLAIEERLSLSPDALTGLEQNLRFPGHEGMEQRIFGRLSAWQNWIFIRKNATGPRGALTSYGKPERPVFDWNRT
jgi:benzoyl-CoA-dihydrodiol lyase